MRTKIPSDVEKKAVWENYLNRTPSRVPLRWNVNPRIILLDPALNPEGYTFESYFKDPLVTLTVQARFQEYLATTLNQTCDSPTALPEAWSFRVDSLNTYDGSYFGGPVVFEEKQIPSNQAWLTLDSVDDFLAQDWSRPLDNPWIKDRLKFHAELKKAAQDFAHLGRKGSVNDFTLSFDGPVTTAAILMGTDFFTLMGIDPEKAFRFLSVLTDAAILRYQALLRHFGHPVQAPWGGMADDSIQLISPSMYEELVLPLHERYYQAISAAPASARCRSIHLCGDATRHFPLISQKLGVSAFDTGFPVDHGALRKALGPDVEISGGPHVALLQNGDPASCAREARRILGSGVKEGGRFILQEGNNLPPCCPLENLQAVYEVCLTDGLYPCARKMNQKGPW